MQQRTRVQSRVRWSPLAQNAMKVNFDGAMFPKSNEAGVGVVIWNEAGEVLAILAEKIHQPYMLKWAVCVA